VEVKQARRLGSRDAEIAINMAREIAFAGTLDPLRLRHFEPNPAPRGGYRYVDSPELPARRIVSDWDDYAGPGLDTRDERPQIARYGSAERAMNAGERAWLAYQDGLRGRLDEAQVGLFDAASVTPFYGPQQPLTLYLYSLYAVDLSRYEQVPPVPVIQPIGGETTYIDERYIQFVFRPLGFGRIARRRWRRRRPRVVGGPSANRWWPAE
jgi:hypothetical protein